MILTYLQDTALHTPDPSGTQTGSARKSWGPVEQIESSQQGRSIQQHTSPPAVHAWSREDSKNLDKTYKWYIIWYDTDNGTVQKQSKYWCNELWGLQQKIGTSYNDVREKTFFPLIKTCT